MNAFDHKLEVLHKMIEKHKKENNNATEKLNDLEESKRL